MTKLKAKTVVITTYFCRQKDTIIENEVDSTDKMFLINLFFLFSCILLPTKWMGAILSLLVNSLSLILSVNWLHRLLWFAFHVQISYCFVKAGVEEFQNQHWSYMPPRCCWVDLQFNLKILLKQQMNTTKQVVIYLDLSCIFLLSMLFL